MNEDRNLPFYKEGIWTRNLATDQKKWLVVEYYKVIVLWGLISFQTGILLAEVYFLWSAS